MSKFRKPIRITAIVAWCCIIYAPPKHADFCCRWNDSGADAAWEAATAKWYPENPNTQLNLSAHIGNFFHAKPDMSCELLGNDNCGSTVPCGEQAFPNADVSSPAGYVSSPPPLSVGSAVAAGAVGLSVLTWRR